MELQFERCFKVTTAAFFASFCASPVELKCCSLSRLDAIHCANLAAMHHINKTKQTAVSGAWLPTDLGNKEGAGLLRGSRRLKPKTSRRFRPLASWVAAGVLLFSPSLPVHGGWLKPDVDFGF
jgi:hypothetical protein